MIFGGFSRQKYRLIVNAPKILLFYLPEKMNFWTKYGFLEKYEFNECVFLYGERKDVIHPDTISYARGKPHF